MKALMLVLSAATLSAALAVPADAWEPRRGPGPAVRHICVEWLVFGGQARCLKWRNIF